MFEKIASNLFDSPKTISAARAIQIINTTNVFISSNYKLLDYVGRKDSFKYDKYAVRTESVKEMHNDCVKPNDWFLLLGEIANNKIWDTKDISSLYETCRKLHGKKIMVRGKNDVFDDGFYNKCGFQYVAKTIVCPILKIFFTAEPVDISRHGFTTEWINIHGGGDGTLRYYDIDYHNHINVHFKAHDNKVLRISEYLKLYKNGYYNKAQTIYKTYPYNYYDL